VPRWIMTTVRNVLSTGTTPVLLAGVLLPWGQTLAATGSELFLTEYVEGSGGNQAVEIYNPTDTAINLGGRYMLAFYYDGHFNIDSGVPLVGVIQPGATWVVTPTNASAALLAKGNQRFGTSWFDGNDAVALVLSGTAVDVLGQVGFDPGSGGWGSGTTSTVDHTLRRKPAVNQGDPNGSNPFDPVVEWDGYPLDTFDGLGNVNERLPNEPISMSCPASVSTNQGEAASAQVSATDPDGTVVGIAVTGVAPSDPGTLTTTGLSQAPGTGSTATADLNVGGGIPVGTYTATLTSTNSDASPQTATCDVAVTVNEPSHSLAHLRSIVDQDVASGSLDEGKAFLLYDRLDRAADDLAAGRTDAYLAQLKALGNQSSGLAPHWMTDAAAGAIRAEAEALAAAS
jgi:hypothetical protein